jgi:hypothetical protein
VKYGQRFRLNRKPPSPSFPVFLQIKNQKWIPIPLSSSIEERAWVRSRSVLPNAPTLRHFITPFLTLISRVFRNYQELILSDFELQSPVPPSVSICKENSGPKNLPSEASPLWVNSAFFTFFRGKNFPFFSAGLSGSLHMKPS